VCYHFACVTDTQFARFTGPNGARLSTLSLHNDLSVLDIEIVDEAIKAAYNRLNVASGTKKVQGDDMEEEEDKDADGESEDSGTEYSPEK
jgi:hypothetical protein